MLQVESLTIRAGGRNADRAGDRAVVTDFSCTVEVGRITCLIGPSGCGKTSVLKKLTGILPPGLEARGTIRIDDAPVQLPHPAIAYQPQSDALFPWLTVAANAALGLEMGGLPRSAARDRVHALLEPFGLAGCERLYPDQLSGGMRQRAAFLRTIVQDCRFVLLDEPFSALDAVTRLAMQDWLRARLLETPRGVLMVTHDLHEATSLADRILVLPGRPGPVVDIPLTVPRADRSEANLADIRTMLRTLLLKDRHP